MDTRTWAFDFLSDDSQLMGMLPGGIIEAGSMDGPNVTPYAMIVVGPRFSEPVGESQGFEIWVHDSAQSYTRIDAALDRAKDLIEAWAETNLIRYEGRSRDLIDDVYNTRTRNDSWRVFARKD
jgi:hypothetical protein